MTSAAQSASPNQTRRRSTRNRAEVTPNVQSNPIRTADPVKSIIGARELNPGHERQTPSRRGVRQLANNNTSSPLSPFTRKRQQETSGNEAEENSAADLIVDNTLESTEPKGKPAIGSMDGVESCKKPRKRLKTTATKIRHAEEEGLDEQGSRRLERKRATKKDVITEKEEIGAENHKSKTSPRTTKFEETTAEEEEQTIEEYKSLNTPLRKRKFKETTVKKEAADEKRVIKKGEESSEKPTRKRKTKEEKEAEAMPLATRSKGLQMFIGAHVSSAKGVHNAVNNCVHIGGNAFALFLRSPRRWEPSPLQDKHKTEFRALAAKHDYDAARHILPHGSYLVNLAQEDGTKAAQAYTAFLDDLHRCEALGINLYNFHPGSRGDSPRPGAIARLASQLNAAHQATRSVTLVIETMTGGASMIGNTFADLRDIIAQVRDQSRVGICLDTCHVFAAGYDLRDPGAFTAVLEDFDATVGLRFLKALHLNDSKTPLGSGRDRHANIGTGFLGLRAFWNVVNEPRFAGLPMVLETPIDRPAPGGGKGKTIEDQGVWAREIKLLESLVGMDVEGDRFRELERGLAAEGKEMRDKGTEAMERKEKKADKAGAERKKESPEKGKKTPGSRKKAAAVKRDEEDEER